MTAWLMVQVGWREWFFFSFCNHNTKILKRCLSLLGQPYKIPEAKWINNKNLLLTVLEAEESKSEMTADLAPDEDSPPDF